ncbi:unnamed protein product [Urochloa humidicola]
MVNAEPDQWKKLIEDNSKVAKFRKKPFPLYNSCQELYEGSIATGDLNFTSTDIPPRRTQHQVEPTLERTQQPIEPTNETSEQRTEFPPPGSLQLPPQRSISSQSIHQTTSRNPFSSTVDGIESFEVQSAPSNQTVQDQEVGGGKKRKQSQMAAKLGDYIDFRKNQIEETAKMIEEKKTFEEDYSIQKCIDMVDAIEDLNDEQKADANELFQLEANRKIFVSMKNPNVRFI